MFKLAILRFKYCPFVICDIRDPVKVKLTFLFTSNEMNVKHVVLLWVGKIFQRVMRKIQLHQKI